MANNIIPTNWSDADILDGLMTVQKPELIGKAFRLTGASFRLNKRMVSIAELDGEFTDGTTFTFTDSSTGIRRQVVDYLTAKGQTVSDTTGEYYTLNIVCPEGVRRSDFTVEDELTGKPISATTYYLTTSGKRAAAPVSSPRNTRAK